ncbi:hypothetical protein [Synechocystis sp. PCC 6714]|uniref:hypothetical protein n=1 Tax=Synechocystis sp. (strain PCC 6714) TaxID=1147 RepID=UPI001EE66B94|nr:hypothetical protein [Synechocystis sp. PCC 6714]
MLRVIPVAHDRLCRLCRLWGLFSPSNPVALVSPASLLGPVDLDRLYLPSPHGRLLAPVFPLGHAPLSHLCHPLGHVHLEGLLGPENLFHLFHLEAQPGHGRLSALGGDI